MTTIATSSSSIAPMNRPQPITTLRDWLDHLAARDRLAVIQPGTALRFELAAIAKRLDGHKATLFPRPGNHAMPVLSGLVSNRQWIADACLIANRRLTPSEWHAYLPGLPYQPACSSNSSSG